MKNTIIRTLAVAAAVALIASEAQAVTKTVKISPQAAKALDGLYTSSTGKGAKDVSQSKSGVTVTRKAGKAGRSKTGNKATITRAASSSVGFGGGKVENTRGGTIVIDLQTGEVSYSYDVVGSRFVFPFLWGICGPVVGGGMNLSVTGSPTGFEARQGPYFEGGAGCGIACANIATTLNVSGGVREQIPKNQKIIIMDLYGSVGVDISAELCLKLFSFKLKGWNLADKSLLELGRVNF